MKNQGVVRRSRALSPYLWAILGLAWILSSVSQAHASDYQRAPTPKWVVPQALDLQAQAPLGQTLDGVHYLLVDQQTQLGTGSLVSYRRFASRVLNAGGAESAAHITIDFDPTYQTLTLHALNLYREGRAQDRLVASQIKVLQRETELEYRVYDGSKTVDVVLHDVRPGDVVEYAYSVRGSNPVLAGLVSGRMSMQWRVPVEQLHRRLMVQSDMPLKFRSNFDGAAVQTTRQGGWTEHVWHASRVAPVSGQRDVPSWYSPYAMVEWSLFDDWGAVARWAQPLYAVPKGPGAALQKEIDRIAAAHQDPAQRLLAVLDFVQSEIRYLGIEMGQGSYRPRSPDAVLANRYGDCKDKVLLAIVMLRALGVQAAPALVDTKRRQAVADLLPTPAAFNHVILKAQVDGQDYWLDPTLPPQKGRIERVAQANYGQALVLDGSATGLTAMPMAEASRYRRRIATHMNVSKGYEHPAPLVIQSVYEGRAADRMRQTLRNDNLADLQRDYLNYYLRYYPGLRIEKPISFTDDELENRLVTQEYYEIPPFFTATSDGAGPSIDLRVPDMLFVLDQPEDRVRTAPYAVQHPEEVEVSLSVQLPEPVSVKERRVEVKDPAFEFFSQSGSPDSSTLGLHYRYRSLADYVNPKDIDSYIANLDDARNQVGYTLRNLSSRSTTERRTAIKVLGFSVAALVSLAALAAAACVVWGLRQRKTRDDVRWGERRLLWTGGLLFWSPTIALFICAATAMVGPKDGMQERVFAILFIAIVGIYLWVLAWKGPWLRCLERLAEDPEVVARKAQRLRLPGDIVVKPEPEPKSVR
jgi:hypothetical protein